VGGSCVTLQDPYVQNFFNAGSPSAGLCLTAGSPLAGIQPAGSPFARTLLYYRIPISELCLTAGSPCAEFCHFAVTPHAELAYTKATQATAISHYHQAIHPQLHDVLSYCTAQYFHFGGI
jgi:hypothetical protein